MTTMTYAVRNTIRWDTVSTTSDSYQIWAISDIIIVIISLILPMMMSVMPLNHVPMYVKTHSSRPNYTQRTHTYTYTHILYWPVAAPQK